MERKIQAHVSDEKKKIVNDLEKLLKEKKTILLASIKNIPASMFQQISKDLRGKAEIKVPKKNLIFRAIDGIESEEIKKLKEQIKDNVAILFSDIEGFELAGDLVNSKVPAKAKTGQIALFDIEVKAGMTDLLPGPAISELGAVGIATKVTNGKLEIPQDKTIVKEGEKISQAAAEVMSKLDIKPFEIGFIPFAVFEAEEGKLYLDIDIDKEKRVEDLKKAFGRALPFAVEIGYVCGDTIGFLIRKAASHEKALEKFEEKIKEKEKVTDAGDKEENNKENQDKQNTQENSGLNNNGNPEPADEAKENAQVPQENKSEEEK